MCSDVISAVPGSGTGFALVKNTRHHDDWSAGSAVTVVAMVTMIVLVSSERAAATTARKIAARSGSPMDITDERIPFWAGGSSLAGVAALRPASRAARPETPPAGTRISGALTSASGPK